MPRPNLNQAQLRAVDATVSALAADGIAPTEIKHGNAVNNAWRDDPRWIEHDDALRAVEFCGTDATRIHVYDGAGNEVYSVTF